jgi:hypothetical protein
MLIITYDSRAKIGRGKELEDGFACMPDFHFNVTVAAISSHQLFIPSAVIPRSPHDALCH